MRLNFDHKLISKFNFLKYFQVLDPKTWIPKIVQFLDLSGSGDLSQQVQN